MKYEKPLLLSLEDRNMTEGGSCGDGAGVARCNSGNGVGTCSHGGNAASCNIGNSVSSPNCSSGTTPTLL